MHEINLEENHPQLLQCIGLYTSKHSLHAPSCPQKENQHYTRDVLPVLDCMARDFDNRHVEMEIGVPQMVFYPYFIIGQGTGLIFQSPSWQSLQIVALQG